MPGQGGSPGCPITSSSPSPSTTWAETPTYLVEAVRDTGVFDASSSASTTSSSALRGAAAVGSCGRQVGLVRAAPPPVIGGHQRRIGAAAAVAQLLLTHRCVLRSQNTPAAAAWQTAPSKAVVGAVRGAPEEATTTARARCRGRSGTLGRRVEPVKAGVREHETAARGKRASVASSRVLPPPPGVVVLYHLVGAPPGL
jgi:hypothetical protein